ncbi:bifunctional phosphopantothenoylcysteine decarboxylase/phosphopantothenate--cysteine ligase CoaBC [Cryobacterium sp. TMT1-3]|uniref:Coenzyme A biosynthesis bifunctional protein CoaBC n=1 Tax=Cryobacterium luteum TaxID=1424661 RepID=A0A1H8D0M2_9MICO|nr:MULTISPECIES: bifunctional phosphopantothenoylcysteine decarboxylase/phosphopantothenate--cysteine ligase CoaBC [Cryobacterium]TFB91832.1 bifunctional phosphopantothenoylcysteine decarboxylase/phosphopantothenate--cysteine ligase CoaBC [Cryobacterium luteum]TFC31194.1 bifunctional phosphopantothenoylcysteine decarboxylase/phosphopantothenate--cysteine ligase CoaBC [Cryobacterium sp. TMT1-3]SEN00224.1 phosphopantothenoylcysteine decarboxylase / phosphopantothenate--cysteine ligase [Cryobacteri
MKTPRTIVVGITGGIAAYKAVNIVRAFVLNGDAVHVVATAAALRFVGKPTLEAISRNPVHTDLYEGVAEVRHVAIGQGADLIVVAPATANSIAKLAAGLADDLLGNTILASTAPLVIAPAMHTEMWNNPATVANVAVLRSRGITIVGPGVGRLTGTDSGAGRMEEPETIVAVALAVLDRVSTTGADQASAVQDLAGRRVLISAGGTREPLDPVRFLGNRSSGKQGVYLAQAALARGARVTLVAANLEVAVPTSVTTVLVSSALQMHEAMTLAAQSAEVIIMAAAVADYRPKTVQLGKIKKEDVGDTLTLELVKNPDILAGLSAARRPGQLIIGFAAETETDADRLLALGREKITRKGCDYLVVNRVSQHEGFGTERNTVTVLDHHGVIVNEVSGSKMSVANCILDLID